MPAASLQVRSGLHHCLVRDRTIFLDVPANRYFALSNKLDSAFRAFIDSGAKTPGEVGIAPLMALGIIVPASSNSIAADRQIDLPALAEVSAVETKAPILLGVEMLTRYLRAVAELRFTSFESVLARRSKDAARWQSADNDERSVGPIVGAAKSIDGLVSSYRRCLPRSLAIFDMLGARGHRPRILIGVGNTAFSGHCWVQVGTEVVGDQIDRVRLFTPILAI